MIEKYLHELEIPENDKTFLGIHNYYAREIDDEVEFILFGSRARGEGNEDSDTDVLILTNQVDINKIQQFASSCLHIYISSDVCYIAIDKNEWENRSIEINPLKYNVTKDGIKILF